MSRARHIQLALTASRALESLRPTPLFIDSLARPLVEASDDPAALALLDTRAPTTDQFVARSRALMTRHYDDALLAATQSGAHQVVLLAGGLDTRAYRLDWPSGVVVFEVDYPELLGFKRDVITHVGALPRADRRQVGTFLSGPWQSDLITAGFDPDLPTAWLAEALVSHLPSKSHDALFERVIEMSALGSTIATDTDGITPSGKPWEDVRDALTTNDSHAPEYLPPQDGDGRTRSGEWLSGHGWLTQTTTGRELADRYGEELTDESYSHEFAERRFLTATLPETYMS